MNGNEMEFKVGDRVEYLGRSGKRLSLATVESLEGGKRADGIPTILIKCDDEVLGYATPAITSLRLVNAE